MKNVDRIIVVFLALIFIYAGFDKLMHYEGFVKALSNYLLVPSGTAPYFAPSLIAIEIFLGVALLMPAWRRPAAVASGALLLIFTAALWVNQQYGDNSVCGCWFTITLAKSSGAHIVQNLVLVALAFFVWLESSPPAMTPKPRAETA